MKDSIYTATIMLTSTAAGWGFSVSKEDIEFTVKMISLITPVVLSVALFIRNGRRNKKNDEK